MIERAAAIPASMPRFGFDKFDSKGDCVVAFVKSTFLGDSEGGGVCCDGFSCCDCDGFFCCCFCFDSFFALIYQNYTSKIYLNLYSAGLGVVYNLFRNLQ